MAKPTGAICNLDCADDDGDLAALRYDNWKLLFLEQRVPATMLVSRSRVARSWTPSGTPASWDGRW
jgi:hypothetical protein